VIPLAQLHFTVITDALHQPCVTEATLPRVATGLSLCTTFRTQQPPRPKTLLPARTASMRYMRRDRAGAGLPNGEALAYDAFAPWLPTTPGNRRPCRRPFCKASPGLGRDVTTKRKIGLTDLKAKAIQTP